MKQVVEILKELEENWAAPKAANHAGHETSPLFCIFDDGLQIPDSLVLDIPGDVQLFWRYAETALLFKDAKYGQWGLEILSPEVSRGMMQREKSDRPEQFLDTDLIIGRFIGDCELLLVNCDRDSSAFGSIIVTNPIDKRENWFRVAPSFREFLDMYSQHEGDKYWERF